MNVIYFEVKAHIIINSVAKLSKKMEVLLN